MKHPRAVLAFGLLAGLAALVLVPSVLRVGGLKARSRAIEAELRKLKEENLKLENEIRLLRHDPVYLEKVARRKFNKAKENETVYKVVRAGQETSPDAQEIL
ncbi:MAG: septum formation initiator family protein [Candidatus Omnitrophica bacterium]|nr:septum formation initiator family protein [Candidatus Omnitrophota bacterium]